MKRESVASLRVLTFQNREKEQITNFCASEAQKEEFAFFSSPIV